MCHVLDADMSARGIDLYRPRASIYESQLILAHRQFRSNNSQRYISRDDLTCHKIQYFSHVLNVI